MKIVVLGGGISPERHVSLVTATSICKGLRQLGHQAVFVDMFLGVEHPDGPLENMFDLPGGNCPEAAICHDAPDLEAVRKSREDPGPSRLGKNVLELCKLADCVFLGLHGADGEDGKIQATLNLMGIPYTGSDMLGSALAMDKEATKLILQAKGLPTPPLTDRAPCVVKEVHGGSSIGTWVCPTEQQRISALKEAKERVIVEKMIHGREFTVPVLGDRALSVIEIVAPDGNFDYVSKYQSGAEGAGEICPARISEEERCLLQDLALKAHKALGLKACSRIDFIVDSDGQPWILEANTIPGMTPNSLIPKAAAVEGLDYPALCEKILELSLKK